MSALELPELGGPTELTQLWRQIGQMVFAEGAGELGLGAGWCAGDDGNGIVRRGYNYTDGGWGPERATSPIGRGWTSFNPSTCQTGMLFKKDRRVSHGSFSQCVSFALIPLIIVFL